MRYIYETENIFFSSKIKAYIHLADKFDGILMPIKERKLYGNVVETMYPNGSILRLELK